MYYLVVEAFTYGPPSLGLGKVAQPVKEDIGRSSKIYTHIKLKIVKYYI